MAMSGRVTRRSTPTASQRFHSAPRSRPVLLLIGGIGACFALVIAFILLGGSAVDDTLPDRIVELESKAHKLSSEDKREEAIKAYEQLVGIAVGDRWRVKVLEAKAAIKELKAESVLVREVTAKLTTWAKAVETATPATARPLWEEGCRLRDAYPRLWTHGPLLDRLLAMVPPPEPTPAELREKIIKEYELERRGHARWGGALRAWKEYLQKPRSPGDQRVAEDSIKTLEQKGREEVRTLAGKATTPEAREALKLHRLRFEGTAAAQELEKAIQGK
jgi:hypothetical protein